MSVIEPLRAAVPSTTFTVFDAPVSTRLLAYVLVPVNGAYDAEQGAVARIDRHDVAGVVGTGCCCSHGVEDESATERGGVGIGEEPIFAARGNAGAAAAVVEAEFDGVPAGGQPAR